MYEARLFIEGKWTDGETTSELPDKLTGAPVALVHVAGQEQVRRATRSVADAQAGDTAAPYERFQYLRRAAELLDSRSEEFIDSIVTDTGFTMQEAASEVRRGCETLLISAEEAKRLTGDMVPIDSGPIPSRRIAFTLRFPLGVVCAITPFNSPLNTVLHKVAPALAGGNGVVLKPATYTPLTAVRLIELLLEAGVPDGLLALLNGGGSTVGQWLLEDEVPAFYAFTGSTAVGEHIRRTVGLRPAQLELGSISSTIVCSDAGDLGAIVPKCLDAAYRKSGQVCTSVQNLMVQDEVYDEFVARSIDYLSTRPAGDPRKSGTYVGPLISPDEATRVRDMVSRAVDAGADVVCGQQSRPDSLLDPTVLADVRRDMDVMTTEVFGPVVALRRFTHVADAFADANASSYGLAAGIFTSNVGVALQATRSLRFGVVNINESSSARVDLMPFGGVKASGTGKEGPHYAIREMTEERLVTMQG
jgi:acyl-CoA reductase-like NAD-dependent aldehyde dehydrogenase